VAEHATLSQDAVEVVRNMKDEGANHMTTMGSLALCRSLLRAGLVDRFRVVVFPVITASTGSDPIMAVSSCLSTFPRFWTAHLAPTRPTPRS
jgi:dihydrofolate reductase